MIDRDRVLTNAVDDCLKELYSFAQPHIDWDKFVEENKIYTKIYKTWERFNYLKNKENLSEDELKEFSMFPSDWKEKSVTECIGPKPFEFYYLPREILQNICDSYTHAYRLDHQQELLDIIQILKNYCMEPIVDKYIDDWTDEEGNHHPGYKDYEHPDNLEKEINTYLDLKFPLMDPERAEDAEDFENKLNTAAKELQDKFFKFLDMAGKFFNWNRDLNSFNVSVYMGPSPNTNKESVIENWKKYRNRDIEIDEKQIKKEYYGESD